MGLAIFCRFDMVGPPNNPPKMADYDMGCGENHLRNPIDMGFLLVKKKPPKYDDFSNNIPVLR